MQVITDFIVKHKGQLINVSHRDNCEHITNGASSTLVYQGIAVAKTTKQLSAWLGDTIDVTDYYGTLLFKAQVIAKMVRHWDMDKPSGQRAVMTKKSNNWDMVFNNYKKQTA